MILNCCRILSEVQIASDRVNGKQSVFLLKNESSKFSILKQNLRFSGISRSSTKTSLLQHSCSEIYLITNCSTFLYYIKPCSGVRLISWSRNCPNCMSIAEIGGFTFVDNARWTVELIVLGLGRLDSTSPPLGRFLLSLYAFVISRVSGVFVWPRVLLARLLQQPVMVLYKLSPSQVAHSGSLRWEVRFTFISSHIPWKTPPPDLFEVSIKI